MSIQTQTLERLYRIHSDLNGTPYKVVLGEDPSLIQDLKNMCYERCPSLSDPAAKDLYNDVKKFAWENHSASDIANLIDAIEIHFT